eukprot:CAMPEP_0118707924 /NCGR_PEP_ID=MMETSP0800-20121206/21529_1 /TAXON_ID=210618 ORGANISM="Striatella unipunctata, Strain CCMP2910" /NCGR_SAMPLE_ID=MMETSP0800 /ASSEMBLY_ACC=CAM_ASM_000638 /LENGTH=196 /DNA_ID=CAMNT_0006610915 /DNA_START=212 /DNA_END=802 /DNA_ORIENTATION=-
MLQSFLENPTNPDFTPIFSFVFASLGIMPLSVASIAVPTASRDPGSLPWAPFVGLSLFGGYFAAGPYLSFRTVDEDVTKSSTSWVGRNVFDNKLFNVGLLLLALYYPLSASGLASSLDQLPQAWESFVEVAKGSQFVSTSSMDFVIFNCMIALLVAQDAKVRGDEPTKANLIGLSTLLLPVWGGALYCALRPSLKE